VAAHVWNMNPQGQLQHSCDLYHLLVGHSRYHHLIQLFAINDTVFHLLRVQLPIYTHL
jgi:hypothetical protein